MTIGEKIRKLRTEAGLPLNKLAKIIGVSDYAFRAWENDVYVPRPENLKKLNQYFGVNISEEANIDAVDKVKENGTQYAQNSEKCRTCDYLWGNRYTNDVCCDYLLRTGQRRGCPGGDNCDKYKPRKGYKTYGKDFKI